MNHSSKLGLLPVVLALATPLAAQCQLDWLPGANTAGPNGSIATLTELANGDIVAAGIFSIAGNAVCANVARWDGVGWRALGQGVNGVVTSSVVMPNGDLMIGGGFSQADGVYVGRIARWDGNSWSSVQADVPGVVRDLAVAPNGDLIAAGAFSQISGQPANGIARYDGASWSGIGAATGLASVAAVTFLSNGDLVVGGLSNGSGPEVVRWNGATWAPLAGIANSAFQQVRDLTTLANGDLVIAAANLAASSSLMVWDGAALAPLTPPLTTTRFVLAASNGDLIAAGDPASNDMAARFDGTNWVGLGSHGATNIATMLETGTGSLVAGSILIAPALPTITTVWERTANTWNAVGVPATAAATINAVERLPNGEIIVGGDFDQIYGVSANNLARFDGTAWQPYGTGTDGPVTALQRLPNGALLIGGDFAMVDGTPATRIARLQNNVWSGIGAGLPYPPKSLAETDSGFVAALLDSPFANLIYTFSGTSWNQLGGLVIGQAIEVVAMPAGDFAMVGAFVVGTPFNVGGLRFFGVLTSVLAGSEGKIVRAVTTDEQGELVFATRPQQIPGAVAIERLINGTMTSVVAGPTMGNIGAVAVLPDGDYVLAQGAGGLFGTLAGDVQRWDGSNWQSLGGGLSLGGVEDLAVSGSGELFASGGFLGAGQQVSIALARAVTNCPASVSALGSGCTGSNAQVTLSANNLPWLGTTFRSTATGMAPISLALHVVGTNQVSVPLPIGAPGCLLLVEPVFTALLLPSNGLVDAPFAIPTTATLTGNVVLTQVVGLELDAVLNLTSTTGSNALALMIGTF